MLIRLILPLVALTAAAAPAMPAQKVAPSEAAKTFTLDGLAPTPTPTPTPTPAPSAGPSAEAPLATPVVPASETVTGTAPTSAAAPPATDSRPPSPQGAAVPPAVGAMFTLDTPIQDLIANPAAKAVLDRDLPGMSDDENLAKFRMLSLRVLQPQTGGQLTDAMLAKVAGDLAAIAGGEAKVVQSTGSSKRDKDDSR